VLIIVHCVVTLTDLKFVSFTLLFIDVALHFNFLLGKSNISFIQRHYIHAINKVKHIYIVKHKRCCNYASEKSA